MKTDLGKLWDQAQQQSAYDEQNGIRNGQIASDQRQHGDGQQQPDKDFGNTRHVIPISSENTEALVVFKRSKTWKALADSVIGPMIARARSPKTERRYVNTFLKLL